MTRVYVSLLAFLASLAGITGPVSRAEAAPASFSIPRTTPHDFVFQVAQQKLWLSPNMRRVSANPPTFVVGHNPEYQYNGWLNACAGDFSYVYVRMAVSSDIKQRTMWIFYWLNDGQKRMEVNRSVQIPLAKDGGMHTYAYAIKNLKLRKGVRFRTLRLDPVEAGSAHGPSRVEISQFRLISALNPRSAC